MTILVFTLVILLGSLLAGFLGSLTGLGGGFVIIPLLTLVFGIDIRYAIGASLVAVIATSSGAASSYVKEGITNMRLGMFLEIATTLGAVAGAFLAVYTSTHIIAILFGFILIFSAILSLRRKDETALTPSASMLAQRLKLNSSYPTPQGVIDYSVTNVPGGFLIMLGAGILSGLLGLGAGVLKVLAMDNVMRVPFKVSTTTSNFMIGVTAAASAGIYLYRGYIDPGLCMPVVLGVLAGAFLGSKVLARANSHSLRTVFAFIILVIALEMLYNGFTKKI